MEGRGFIEQLAGGRRSSAGESKAVVEEIQQEPRRAAELWDAVAAPDPLVRIRAVDALEKVSATHPEVLRGHELEVLEELATSDLSEVRWHAGQLIPRLTLPASQLRRAVAVLEQLMTDRSRIAQANALTGLVELADRHPELADRAEAAMTLAFGSPYASVRARARRLAR